MTAMLVSVLGASLVGSAHCAAMCGAFACTAADSDPGTRLRSATTYHLARLAAYAALGAAAGAVGARLDSSLPWEAPARPAAIIAGSLLVAWGAARAISLAGVRFPRIDILLNPRLVPSVLRWGRGRSSLTRAALLGAVAPLLPCGWLYAFLAPAAASGSAAAGAAVMAAFWTGTLPALAALALGFQRALGPARRILPLLAALALVVVGSMTIARAARDPVAGRRADSAAHHVDRNR